jgi:uncharacterized protein YjbI with pentapeptide repeats
MANPRREQSGEPAEPRLAAELRAADDDLDGLDGAFQLFVQGRDFSNADLAEAEIEQCRLSKVSLAGVRGSGTTLVDCEIDQSDLANAVFEGGGLRRVRVTDCRLTGLTFLDGMVRDVTFRASKVDMVNFRSSTLLNVAFVGCDLTRADFYGTDLRGAVFTDCVLTGAQFSQAKMTGTRLAGCDLSGIGGVASMAGASIRADDVMALTELFAAELGITIEALGK